MLANFTYAPMHNLHCSVVLSQNLQKIYWYIDIYIDILIVALATYPVLYNDLIWGSGTAHAAVIIRPIQRRGWPHTERRSATLRFLFCPTALALSSSCRSKACRSTLHMLLVLLGQTSTHLFLFIDIHQLSSRILMARVKDPLRLDYVILICLVGSRSIRDQ